MIEQQQIQFHTPPASVHQWQWEEAVNALRNLAPEKLMQTHWSTTGHRAIDATARAHIAEWAVLDGPRRDRLDEPTSIINTMVQDALAVQNWDLYTVEAVEKSTMAVRSLRDQRGYRIQWLEGRCPPVPDTLVALRLVHLEPPGLYASTIPLIFGKEPGPHRLMTALLRAFGANGSANWRHFMGGTGARILLEYALSNLEVCAQEKDRRIPGSELSEIEESFCRLEKALLNHGDLVPSLVVLSDGRLAWLEDDADGPHLLIFKDRESWRNYRRHAMSSQLGSATSDLELSWCRAYRVAPDALHPVEWELAKHMNLRPEQNGIIRLQRRNTNGHFVDPTAEDLQGIEEACLMMSDLTTICAA